MDHFAPAAAAQQVVSSTSAAGPLPVAPSSETVR